MPQPTNSKALRLQIIKSFDLEELELLCEDVGVRFGNLSGTKIETKAHSLIKHMQKDGRMHDLLRELQSCRSHINWESLYPVGEEAQQQQSATTDEYYQQDVKFLDIVKIAAMLSKCKQEKQYDLKIPWWFVNLFKK
jgi:hypothetical protein